MEFLREEKWNLNCVAKGCNFKCPFQFEGATWNDIENDALKTSNCQRLTHSITCYALYVTMGSLSFWRLVLPFDKKTPGNKEIIPLKKLKNTIGRAILRLLVFVSTLMPFFI